MTKRVLNIICLTGTFVISSLFPKAAFSQTYNSDWKHQVGVTGYAFGMEGDAGVKGLTAEIDYGINDVASNLEGAFTFLVQGTNSQFGYWLSYEFMELGDDVKRVEGPLFPNATFRGMAEFGTLIIDGGLSYFLTDNIELIAGIRYWDLDQDFKLLVSSPKLPEPVNFEASVDESWRDFIGGVRLRVPLGGNWNLNLRGDIGTGDSDSAYQFVGMFSYDVNDCWTTSAGVRYLAVDYENDGFTFDMRMSGFEVAVLYRL